jgi:hypothetical protein
VGRETGHAQLSHAAGMSLAEAMRNYVGSLINAVPPTTGSVGLPIIWLADDGSPIGADAARSMDPIGAGNVPSVIGFADDRSPIGSNASRSVDPVGTSSGVSLLGESKSSNGKHD